MRGVDNGNGDSPLFAKTRACRPRAPRSRDSSQRGFTLIELAVTLAIVAILLTLAMPRLPTLGRTDLESSADRLATTMTYLADEASLRGRIYRLTVDIDDGEWRVTALAPFAPEKEGEERPGFREDAEDPMAESVALPSGVVFDAVLDRDGETASGERNVFFLPEGLTESLGVRLAEGETTVVVTLDATRGSARREEVVEEKR